ncbi:hypothetical protein B0H66DRAFT_596152 [Apodospora peruviana]|uniref:Uncharacterized protein n=1 Tax=Apodospora peruviana TaxID=516989 RepID=A0AAE0HSA9_9PEZI|nr:hypothetical protein B0H66DRAFT_596152 [Apodospora peruviana]
MPHDTMYPDWPRSSADLVPLPRGCDGPKLKPFDFQGGPQAIEFLEYAGEGLHAHLFKVRILGQIYALKLFRFCYDNNWLAPARDTDPRDRELMSAFYDSSEPFNCKCRAYGRLQEAGHEDLVLLDEDHEAAIYSRFANDNISFNGDIQLPGLDGDHDFDMRARFLGRDGWKPPVHGIVKEFVVPAAEEDLTEAEAAKMLRDIGKLQQLGILCINVAARQVLGGKFSNFSTAITVPHFFTTPELNPTLTPGMRGGMELETFQLALADYLTFDDILKGWNTDHAANKGYTIDVRAFPGGEGSPPLRRYALRNEAAREPVFTYVHPRRYDWKRKRQTVRRRVRLWAKPPMWIYYCGDGSSFAEELRGRDHIHKYSLFWDYKDGFIYPRLDAPASP